MRAASRVPSFSGIQTGSRRSIARGNALTVVTAPHYTGSRRVTRSAGRAAQIGRSERRDRAILKAVLAQYADRGEVVLTTPMDGRMVMAKKATGEGVYRVIDVIGTSKHSWEDATKNAVETATRSLRDLRIAEVQKLDVKIDNGKIVAYRARVQVSFKYEA